MQSLRVSNTRCLPEKSSSRARGVFSNKTRFVFAHEAHLCHRTDFLFEALVAMLRTCVFLRHPYISAAQLQEWSMRKRVTYRAVPYLYLYLCFVLISVEMEKAGGKRCPMCNNQKGMGAPPKPKPKVGKTLRYA